MTRSRPVLARLLAAALLVASMGCGTRSVSVAADGLVDPCTLTPTLPVDQLLGGPSAHGPAFRAGFAVPNSTKLIPAQQCTFRVDPASVGTELVVRVSQERARELMAKLPKDHLAPVAALGDEAYWEHEGQAVFVRKGEVLLGVHLIREDGLDRGPAIQELARTLMERLRNPR